MNQRIGISRELPHPDQHLELFYQYKRPDEHLGLATIDRQQINFPTAGLQVEIPDYFRQGIQLKDHQYDWGRLRHLAESYIKCVYLTRDYLAHSHRFRNPVCAHWDPTIKRYQIHPGRDRAKVMDLFGADQFQVLLFNTGGHPQQFDQVFDTAASLKEHFAPTNTQWHLSCTAEHGSLIPNVFLDWFRGQYNQVDPEQVPLQMQHTHHLLQKFWHQHQVHSNGQLVQWHSAGRGIRFQVHNPRGEYKAWILAPIITADYQDSDVAIQFDK